MVQLDIQISIITVNYNGLKDTCELIDTLPIEDESVEVIVVDNASQEDEATIIEQLYPKVKIVRSKENLGHQQRYTSQTSDLRPQTSHQSSGVFSKDWCGMSQDSIFMGR